MAYQTGSATSPTNLRTLLYAFATANGWTDTSGVLSNGPSYVRIVAVDTEVMTIEGDNDGLFTAGACPQDAQINIEASVWPVTYRFFAHASPEYIACIVQYDVSRIQQLWFGSVVKNGTWTGGNWFGASKGPASIDPLKFLLTATGSGGTFISGPIFETANGAAAPFWNTPNVESFNGTYQENRASFVHAEIDGQIWPGAGNQLAWPSWPDTADPLHQRQPNVYNNEVVLLPMTLFFPRADSFYSPIGHLAHMRAVRIDNYNIADIIDITPDKWMVFPWHKKDIETRDGGLTPNDELDHTGTFGVAIAYDGP